MGKTLSTGLLTNGIWQDASNNIGVGAPADASFKLKVTGATNLTGVLTLGSTISNGTYTYTLPGATGTLALLSQVPSIAGLVPTSRILTINGVSYNLTADASWTVSGGTTLNGTGFVKASGTTISYDNTSYLPLSGGTITGTLSMATTGTNYIRMGVFPNSTSNSGEAWIGRASDRNTGTMTVQLGGGSASSRSFEVVDYSWSTVLFNVNSDGNVFANTSFRAPIFYDSTNTGYYAQPSSYSSFYGLAIRGDNVPQGTGNQLNLWGPGNTTTSAIGFKQVGGVWAEYGTTGGYNTYFTMDTSGRGWVFRLATIGGSNFTGTNVASITNTGNGNFAGTLYAAAYRGNANVAGTGEATYHPAGIYSIGTNWLYGTIIMNGNSITGANSITASNFYGTLNGAATSATSATSATYLNSSNYIQRGSFSGNCNSDFQNTPAGTYRYNGDQAGDANNPGGSWWFIENFRHSNASNYWGIQVAWGWEDNANRLATRNVSGNSFGGWVYYINSGNIGSQSVSYANSAGSLAANASASNIYNDGWFRNYGDSGLYNQDYAAHFRRNASSSYGTWEVFGYNKGGYAGINLVDNSGYWSNLMYENGSGGMYQQNGQSWHFYFFYGNDCLGLSGSETYDWVRACTNGKHRITNDSWCDATSWAYAFSNISDGRLKENIITVDSALDKVLQLRGVYYNWIIDTEQTKHIGLIAQETAEVCPEVVNYHEETDTYSVNYSELSGLFVESTKELNQKLLDANTRIELLETKLNQLLNA